jgi:hypothetical protein
VGAGSAIYLARENREAEARGSLARAFANYLAALEALIYEFRRRPWHPVFASIRALRKGGYFRQALYNYLFWLDRRRHRQMEGERGDLVWDRYFGAAAHLRVVAPLGMLAVISEVEDAFRNWRERGYEEDEWIVLRSKLLRALHEAEPKVNTQPRRFVGRSRERRRAKADA